MKWNQSLHRHVILRLFVTAFLSASCVITAPSLRADTVFLKDGKQILDCKVTKETRTMVYLRTPMGNMGVPRSAIFRIQRVRTAYDVYEDRLAAIPKGDVNGLYKLALQCRKTDGLRKESDEILAKIIALNPNHAGARRLLGHLKIDGKWVVPPPLSIRLKVSRTSAGAVQKALYLFLKDRKDMRLAPEPAAGKPPADPLDSCTLNVSVTRSAKAGARFYGKTVGKASFGVSVRLQARAPWVGTPTLRTALDGLAPRGGTDTALAIQNAFSAGDYPLHKFLDLLAARRSKKLAEKLKKKAREESKKKRVAREAS